MNLLRSNPHGTRAVVDHRPGPPAAGGVSPQRIVRTPTSAPAGTVRYRRRPTAPPPAPPRRVTTRRILWGAAALAALAFAWSVLVTMRLPGSPVSLDQLGIGVESALARTIWYDRVASVLTWAITVATTLVLGGVIFRAFVTDDGSGSGAPRRSPTERALHAATVIGIVAGLVSLPLRAIAVSGGSIGAALDLDLLGFVLGSSFGDAALLRIAGLAIILIQLASRRADVDRPLDVRRWGVRLTGHLRIERRTTERASCLLGAVLIIASYALVGHPQATATFLVVCQAVHILAVATWFGGVAFIALELHHQRRHPSRHIHPGVVHRFGNVAGGGVAVASVSGVILAVSQLGSIGSLFSTGYGQALLAKLVIVAVVAAIGAFNHQRVVPAIVNTGAHTWPRLKHNLRMLRRTTTAEAVLIGTGVLVATAAMVSGGF